MRYSLLIAGVLCIILSMGAVLWWTGQSQQASRDIPYIVCTTGIIADTVSHITGDYAKIDYLMGPGVDPHLYRARESDVHRLAAADIIFYNGLHLEGKMDDVFDRMQAYTRTVAVTQDMPRSQLRSSEFAGLYDPHVWFDVALWKYTIDTITHTLIEQFPQYADIYRRNADWYRQQLDSLEQYVRSMVRQLSPGQRRLITAHDAFGYFGKAYDFDVVGLQGISTDSQVGTYDIMQLADYIVRHKVSTIFIEASIPRRNIQAVQEAVAARGYTISIGDQLYSDTLGALGSQAETYIDMVQYNVQTIVAALRRSG